MESLESLPFGQLAYVGELRVGKVVGSTDGCSDVRTTDRPTDRQTNRQTDRHFEVLGAGPVADHLPSA